MMGGYYGYLDGGLGMIGGIMMIIFWGVIIYFFFQLINNSNTSNRGGSRNALDILKERYARGEITKAEFEEMKKDLM